MAETCPNCGSRLYVRRGGVGNVFLECHKEGCHFFVRRSEFKREKEMGKSRDPFVKMGDVL